MEQPVNTAGERGSLGAILRAYRHEAWLSQEQLAARAGLCDRTVRNLEADRVQWPRADTVRLLAEALELSQPERKRWYAAARAVNHRPATPAITGAGGQLSPPDGADAEMLVSARELASGNKDRRDGSPARKLVVETYALHTRGEVSTGLFARDVDATKSVTHALENGRRDIGPRRHGRLTAEDRQELADLRRENRSLREDMEILRRAAAIFAAAAR